MISETITRTDPEQVSELLAAPFAPLNRSATGYGPKVPTRYQIRYSGRLHRVYAMVYGNSGSLYIISRGQDLLLDLDTEQALQDLSDSGESARQIRQPGPLTIGDRSSDGLLEIMDTNWAADGSFLVTVRELIGHNSWAAGLPLQRMRRLARKAAPLPAQTIKSSRVIRTDVSGGSDFVTFALIMQPVMPPELLEAAAAEEQEDH